MDLNKKKKLFTGMVEFSLAVLSIIIIQFQKMDLKLIILSVLLLLFSLGNIKYAFSSKNAYTTIERMDERDKSISLAINNMMFKIMICLIVVIVITAILIYSFTCNLNIIIAIIPLLVMLPVMGVFYIIVCFYYENKI